MIRPRLGLYLHISSPFSTVYSGGTGQRSNVSVFVNQGLGDWMRLNTPRATEDDASTPEKRAPFQAPCPGLKMMPSFFLPSIFTVIGSSNRR